MEIHVDYKRIDSPIFKIYDLIDSESYTIEYYDPETMDVMENSVVDTDSFGTLIVSFPDNKLNDTVFIKTFPTNDPTNYENSWADYVTLVRPYCDIEQTAAKFNISVDKAVEFEKIARLIIDSMTGGFSYEDKTKTVIGGGLDYLPVNERIVSFSTIKENGELIWDKVSDWQENYSVSTDRSSIVLDGQADRKEYKTVWDTRWTGTVFGLNNDYEITGRFGWAFVPNDIQEAALYLIEDQVCGNTRHIERYINNIRTDGYSLQYVDAAFTGTGNSMVDRILAKYKKVNLNPGVL